MTDQYELKFTIHALPPLNSASNLHWRKKHRIRREWEWLVRQAIGKNGPDEPLERASVECVRYSAKEPDADNTVESFKIVIDCLVRCGVLVDDAPRVIGKAFVMWSSAKAGQGHIQVTVCEEDAGRRVCPACGQEVE